MSIFNWRSLQQKDPQAYKKLQKIRRAGKVPSPFGGTILSSEASREFRRTLRRALEKVQGK